MITSGSIEEIDASAAADDDAYRPTPRVVFDNFQPPPTPLLRADINRSLRMTDWDSVEEIDASDATRAAAAAVVVVATAYLPTAVTSCLRQPTLSCLQAPATDSLLVTPPPTVTWSSSCVPSCSIHVCRSASNPSLKRYIFQTRNSAVTERPRRINNYGHICLSVAQYKHFRATRVINI